MVPIQKNSKPVLVFDFDGTLCDSYTAAIDAFNSLSKSLGYNTIPRDRLEELRDLNFNELIQMMGINPSFLGEVAIKVLQVLETQMTTLPLIPGIKGALKELRRKDYRLGVLTSNTEKNVRTFADHHSLELDFIYGDGHLLGKHEQITVLMKDFALAPEQMIYIGDETRDIEATKKVGVKIIAVEWGFNSAKALRQHQPDWLIQSPEMLLQTLEALRT